MQILHSLKRPDRLSSPVIVTIGNFDGVHLGHRSLLQFMQHKKESHGTSIVLTFRNHPKSIFDPDSPLLHLVTTEHKLQLLKSMGIDSTLLLPFTRELADLTYQEFISMLRESIPFQHLVLGKGATIGKNREGHEENMRTLAKELGFEIHYISKEMAGSAPISSGRIRRLIESGSMTEAANLLGRPFSYFFKTQSRQPSSLGQDLHILRIYENNFISPPPGLYLSFLINNSGETKPAIADVQKSPSSLSFDLYCQGDFPSEDIYIAFPLPAEPETGSIEQLFEKINLSSDYV